MSLFAWQLPPKFPPAPPRQPIPPPRPPGWDDPALLGVILSVLAVVFVVLLLFSLITALQARRRGYLLLPWLLAGALGNPIFLLVLLGVLPDFRRKNLRRKEMKDIENRMHNRPRRDEPVPPAAPAPTRSLGDAATRLPERSLGDDPTIE